MSDANWREAARALRNGTVSPETFVDALGDDYSIIKALNDSINRKEWELRQHFCSCGHEYFNHYDKSVGNSPLGISCWATVYEETGKTISIKGRCGCKKFDALGGPTQRPKPQYKEPYRYG